MATSQKQYTRHKLKFKEPYHRDHGNLVIKVFKKHIHTRTKACIYEVTGKILRLPNITNIYTSTPVNTAI